jgi:hypothetical protein
MEERESFDKLIRALEDATEEAAKILGSNARSSFTTRHATINHAYEIYEYLCDLLDEARDARLRLD